MEAFNKSSTDGAGGAEPKALEDRLRNMIINNTPSTSEAGQQGTASKPVLLPDASVQSQQIESETSAPSKTTNTRKRLNQAQRRQMSAQLSIPIDPRSPGPAAPQSARSYASPPGHHQQYQQHQHHAGSGQWRGQRPHSATFQQPTGTQNSNIPDAPLTGPPLRSHPRHQQSPSYHGPVSPAQHQDWRQPQQQQQHQQGRGNRGGYRASSGSFDAQSSRIQSQGNSPHWNNNNRLYQPRPDDLKAQTDMLEGLCQTIIADAEIDVQDIVQKERFRAGIEEVARLAITRYEREQNGLYAFPPESVQLKCFGSLSSGFATKAADMDLGLLSPLSPIQPDAPNSPIPRLVEKAFLDVGLGARLLVRTRVPIIKVCEKPPATLREDLLEERAKWERGVVDEPEEEDHHEDHPPPLTEGPQSQHKPDAAHDENASPEQRIQSLRQGEHQTLTSYYGSAKGLLRKLGGRDLTNSNAADFTKEDFELLNNVSLAFVEGLADQRLRSRLLNYKSLSKYDLAAKSLYRTLLGVFTQAEGEMMVGMWESRQITEKDERQEQQAHARIRAWTDLQNSLDIGADPLFFNKELQLAADRLRKIPSIQLMLLAQGQHDTASTYHSMAIRAMVELGGHDTPSPGNQVLPMVIQSYIKGIHVDEVREQVAEFAAAHQHEPLTLRAVARRHKSLQLAYEYDKCLEKNLYPEESVPKIKAYIGLLRGSMTKASSPDSHFDYIVSLDTFQTKALVSEIRQLGDPSRMAPNQPRDTYRDRLEFPKSGVGVQCDINFSAHLALQNTLLLRCYSHCDPRVRPLVLFIKHWAKVRNINSPYRGTLSSYGYVLMVLHYLVNVAQPFVCPNLQQLARPIDPNTPPELMDETIICKGRNVQFWRDEEEIKRLARDNVLTQNRDSIGTLLRGFFEYYAQKNMMSTVPGARGFDWGRDVLSLRTHGGLLSKQEKGWTGAKTVVEVKNEPEPSPQGSSLPPHQFTGPPPPGFHNLPPPAAATPLPPTPAPAPATREVKKEVRYRYLFAIEDPFELDHNVARTVTHNGIVAIRDEFRRAWRIIKNAGRAAAAADGGKGGTGGGVEEQLLEDVAEAGKKQETEMFEQLLVELHGRGILP